MRIGLEQVDDASEAEHGRHGEQALGDQRRVVDRPQDAVHLPAAHTDTGNGEVWADTDTGDTQGAVSYGQIQTQGTHRER